MDRQTAFSWLYHVLHYMHSKNLGPTLTLDFTVGGYQSMCKLSGPTAHHIPNFSKIKQCAVELLQLKYVELGLSTIFDLTRSGFLQFCSLQDTDYTSISNDNKIKQCTLGY